MTVRPLRPIFCFLLQLAAGCTQDERTDPSLAAGPSEDTATTHATDSTDGTEGTDDTTDSGTAPLYVPEGPWVAFDGHPHVWCAANAAGEIGCFEYGANQGFRCFNAKLDTLAEVQRIEVPYDPVFDWESEGAFAVAVHRSDASWVWGGWCEGHVVPSYEDLPGEHGLSAFSTSQLLSLGEWSLQATSEGLHVDHSCLLPGNERAFPDDEDAPTAPTDISFARANPWGACTVDSAGVARCGGFVPGAVIYPALGGVESPVFGFKNARVEHAGRDVTTGFLFICTLDDEGTPACTWADESTWPDGTQGGWPNWNVFPGLPPDLTPPADTRFLDIEAGARHVCGLTEDRMMKCWGDTSDLRVDELPGPFQDISAWCGLNREGVIECAARGTGYRYCQNMCDETGCDGVHTGG